MSVGDEDNLNGEYQNSTADKACQADELQDVEHLEQSDSDDNADSEEVSLYCYNIFSVLFIFNGTTSTCQIF